MYNTHATYMLSAIIERVTGQNLIHFLMPRLFDPLGIAKPSWESCPKGIIAGGMGLSLTTESVAKFGQMLLNKGTYNNQRIVSEKYIALATMEQSDNRSNVDRIDSAQGYGYQFHLCRRGAFRGDGAFGQLCFIAPKENIVIAATSSFKSMNQLQMLLDLIYECIIDHLNNATIPIVDNDASILEQQLTSIKSSFAQSQPLLEDVIDINNDSYALVDNPHKLNEISFYMSGELLKVEFRYEDSGNNKIVPFNLTQAVHTQASFAKDLSQHQQEVVTYASWLNNKTLKLTMIYIETPYVVTYTIQFQKHGVHIYYNWNLSFSPIKEFEVMGKQLLLKD